jgi:transcriptional accessory protein Tex/SPT6
MAVAAAAIGALTYTRFANSPEPLALILRELGQPGARHLSRRSAVIARDDFAAMLNESLGGENEGFEGRVVKGTVTAIENDLAVIDVGLKSEGRVPLREFAAPGQKAELKVGDEVEVYVDRVENHQGEAMLSPRPRPPRSRLGQAREPNMPPATASRA